MRFFTRLLASYGSLWVTIDDNEAHYLKVLGDEVFGRECFIGDVSGKSVMEPPNDRKIGSIHDHMYSAMQRRKKTLAEEHFNLMPRTEKADAQYQVFREPDGPDPRGPFRKIDTTANATRWKIRRSLIYPITNPYTGKEVWPRKGTCWRHSKEDMTQLQTRK